MNFLIADTFIGRLTRLTGDDKKAAKTTAFDLQMNPSAPGLSFHKLDKAKARRFWKAVRVLRLLSENRISEVVHQARHVLVVLLTDVLGELAVRAPDVVPADRPRAGVCPRLIHRRFVVQGDLVPPGALLG